MQVPRALFRGQFPGFVSRCYAKFTSLIWPSRPKIFAAHPGGPALRPEKSVALPQPGLGEHYPEADEMDAVGR